MNGHYELLCNHAQTPRIKTQIPNLACTNDACLDNLHRYAPRRNIGKLNIMKVFGCRKTKGPQQNSHNRLRRILPMIIGKPQQNSQNRLRRILPMIIGKPQQNSHTRLRRILPKIIGKPQQNSHNQLRRILPMIIGKDNGKQRIFLIRNSLCYSQSSPQEVWLVIKERKTNTNSAYDDVHF